MQHQPKYAANVKDMMVSRIRWLAIILLTPMHVYCKRVLPLGLLASKLRANMHVCCNLMPVSNNLQWQVCAL